MLLGEDSPRAEQPPHITLQLKPHQLASLHQMMILDRSAGFSEEGLSSNIGILSDRAGYGKTMTMLSLIAALKGVDCQWMPHIRVNVFKNYGVLVKKEWQQECVKCSLIVVPDKLVPHWHKHLADWTDLSFEVVTRENVDKIYVQGYDVILCPALLYNRFLRLNDYYWNRVVFDEADSINIPDTEYVKSRFLWLMSATFENIVRRKNRGFLTELFVKCQRVDQFLRNYPHIQIKGSDEFVKKSFNLIEPEIQFIECLTPAVIHAVRNYIDNNVLALMNAGDIDGAITRLGGNVTTDRNIIELVTRNIRNEMVRLQMKLATIEQLELPPEEKEEKKKDIVGKVESLKRRQESLESSINNSANTTCSICIEILNHPTLVPCCNNIFCATCIVHWLRERTTCPLCRGELQPSQLCTLKVSSEDLPQREAQKQLFSKFETLVQTIRENHDGKFLVFSGHTTAFRELQTFLKGEHIQFGVLTTSNTTQTTLSKFRSGALNVILLDAVNNGAGLEIPEATHVILLHEMNPNLEIQAVARAQRPGRSGKLKIVKLKYAHEYSSR